MTDFRSNIPLPGEIVTVTTRRLSYVLGNEGYKYNIYKNVKVLEPSTFAPPNSFRITGSNKFPERVLSMINIAKLQRGSSTYKRVFKTEPIKIIKIKVPGSKGNEYTVTLENNEPTHCTCLGFHYRKNCRHLQEAKNL